MATTEDRLRDAVSSSERTSRQFPSEEAPTRSPFERDRDRILHSSAFRRLVAVTQVVDPTEGHIFHNRLIHSFKVGQIGRRLAQKLLREQPEEAIAVGGIDPEVVEAAGLAHDLGHPPFGHVAEKKLDELLTASGVSVPDGYEGNAQSFRILTKLSVRSKDQLGLNLTRATLAAVMKYPWFRATSGRYSRKWGAYHHTEESEFSFVRLDKSSERRSAEAELMDWADDLTYAVHDVEDFYCAGLVPLDRLTIYKEERERLAEEVFKRRDSMSFGMTRADFEQIAHKIFGSLATREVFKGTHPQRAALRETTSSLINFYVGAIRLRPPATAADSYVEIKPEAEADIKVLKELTWHYVIENPVLATQQHGKERVIAELFEMYMDASSGSRWRSILPVRCQEELSDDPPDHIRARVVADTISSFSDQECLLIHGRLTGRRSGSLLDALPR